MDLHAQTSEILGFISDTADSICSDKTLFPKENGNNKEAKCVFIGLMTCLVAAMGDNTKLAYNLLPQYLSGFDRSAMDKDYKKCSKASMSYYGKFRDIGARVQFASADWEDVMMQEFTDLIISSLNIESSDNNKKTILGIVRKFVDDSKTYTESEITIIKTVSHKKALIGLSAIAVILFLTLGASLMYAYNLRNDYNSLNASVESLQAKNDELVSTVSSQEEVIASLNSQIDDLNDANSELDYEIAEFSTYIEEHEADIQVAEHIGSYDESGEEGSGRFYADNYVVTTSGDEVSINVTMEFYGTCDLQGDNKRISAAWGDHFTDNGTIKVTFTPVKKGATTFHFFNDQNGDTFDVLVIYM